MLAISNISTYAEWLQNKQNPLASTTINSYVLHLKSFTLKLEISDEYRRSVFDFLSVPELSRAVRVFLSANNYDATNRAMHGSFNTAIKYYEKFLQERYARKLRKLIDSTDSEILFRIWLSKQVSHYSSVTIKSYVKVLSELPAKLISNSPIPNNLNNVDNVEMFDNVVVLIRNAINFNDVNKSNSLGFLQGTFSASLKQYERYLNYLGDIKMIETVQKGHNLAHRTNILDEVETDIERTIISRNGQSRFRQKLLVQSHKCELCGLQYPQLLIASHIKPWRFANNYERLDLDNGLVLCAMHDALFDKGLISFNYDEGGKIAISRSLHIKDYGKLNINNNMLLENQRKRANYMDFHFNHFFVERG